jgi:hypothetical protein
LCASLAPPKIEKIVHQRTKFKIFINLLRTTVLGNLEDLGSIFSIFGGWLFAQVGSSPFWFSYGPILFMVYLYFVFNFRFIILICMCYDLNLKKNETVTVTRLERTKEQSRFKKMRCASKEHPTQFKMLK